MGRDIYGGTMMSTQTQKGPVKVVVTPNSADLPRTDVSTERGAKCTYDPHSDCYRARFDGDSTSPSEAVIDVLAAVEATDPADLPPLFHAVDPDALDSLAPSAGADEESLTVSFAYAGHDVTVTA